MAREFLKYFALSPATLEDVPGMVAVVLSSFANDFHTRLNFGTANQAAKERWLTNRLTTQFTIPGVHQFVVRELSSNKIAGISRWAFPIVLTEAQKQEKERKAQETAAKRSRGEHSYPEGANIESFDALFDGLNKYRSLYVNPQDTYVLEFLGVHQEYQGKGVAGMLLRYGLDLADAEGRKTYLESTEAGHPVYLKLSFRDIDLLTIDTQKWGGDRPATNWIMIREPVTAIGS